MSRTRQNCVFEHMQPAKAQTSQRVRATWSEPSLPAHTMHGTKIIHRQKKKALHRPKGPRLVYESSIHKHIRYILARCSSYLRMRGPGHLGHEPDMVYPRGSFVDHDFLKAQCLRSILQHVSPLAVGALCCNSLL